MLELVLKQASFPKCQVRRGKNGRDPWGAQSTNHCPFRAFLLRSLPRGQQDRPEQGWEEKAGPSAERIPLGRGRASRPSGPGAPAFLEVGGPGFCLAHVGLHPGRGLDRASTFTGLRAEETQMCL